VWTPIAVKNVLAIAPGSYHCLYLDRDGKVFGTGAASESQIGDQLDKVFFFFFFCFAVGSRFCFCNTHFYVLLVQSGCCDVCVSTS
jgi:hypothetical protein